MTGFASTNITLERSDGVKSDATLSLKSLNSRFFELHCRLPFALSNLETALSKRIKKRLLRGQVYLTAHLENPALFQGDITPDLSIVTGYVQALDTIKQQCNISGQYSLDTLITLPNVFFTHARGLDEALIEQIFDAVDHLVAQVTSSQQSEGNALKSDLLHRISQLSEHIAEIKEETNRLVEKTKETIKTTSGSLDDEQNNAIELAQLQSLHALLDKIDTHEEIVRFESHLDSLRSLLESDTIEKGKRIDFTLQELMREINTIAAKCSDASITSHAINAKVEIEKAREQTQNIV